MKIALIYPVDRSIWLFRQELISTLIEMGHEVVLICKSTIFKEGLEALGCRHIEIDMARFVEQGDRDVRDKLRLPNLPSARTFIRLINEILEESK